MTVRCAIIGSGNIGTDLMIKVLRSPALELVALVGIDPASDGLARARKLGIQAPHTGIDWVREHAADVDLVFDATSAYVHVRNASVLAGLGIPAIDLTPAARGPKVVPTVNLGEHLDAPNVNMVTCGGQATVPDEFTRTTARALEEIGGAGIGKAIIILNPAEPPILMRNTVFSALPEGSDHDAVLASVEQMVADVARYVPGYRLKNRPVIEEGPFATPGGIVPHRVVVLLEVEGAGDYLPSYAGNLDIMTAAATAVGEAKAARMAGVPA